jgi:hypothetical protein
MVEAFHCYTGSRIEARGFGDGKQTDFEICSDLPQDAQLSRRRYFFQTTWDNSMKLYSCKVDSMQRTCDNSTITYR